MIFLTKSSDPDSDSIKIENQSPLLVKEDHYVDDWRQFEIARLGQKALTLSDLDSFMGELVKIVSKSLDTEYVKILELTPDQKRLKLTHGIGWHKGIVGNAYVNVDYTSQAGFTLINKKPTIVTNFKTEDRFTPPPLLTDHKVVSGISLTIPGTDGPFGILGAHSKKPKNFTANDVAFFHSATYILSSAIIHQQSINSIKQEEEKYRLLLQYASDAIFITNKEGKFIDFNTKACEITQYSREQLLQLGPADIYPPEDVERIPIKFREAKINKNLIFERRILRKDGTLLPIEVNLTQLPDENYQAICRDISFRKETEELLRTAQKMEAIGRVTGGIAHDFNNYLTIITGYAERILTSNESYSINEIQSDANQIKNTSEKASSLIRELLSFSRKKHYETSIINVNKLIKDFQKSLTSFLGEKILLNFDFDNNISLMDINPDQLQQSLLNLVINAKDALQNTPNGKIIVKTFNYKLEKNYENYAFNAKSGNFVAISIIDNGIGMSDEVKSHLFEPFFTTKSFGTGLGLASIYGFVNEFDGFITVDSELNNGTEITIYFRESDFTESSNDGKTKSSKINKSRKIKNVLLIEDNDELLQLLTTALKKNGFEVYCAINGKLGLEILLKNEAKIDLIISDIVMPEMDGLELMNKLEDMKIYKKTILMTGYSLKDPSSMNFNQDVTVIQKPFSVNKLFRIINQIE